MSIIFTSRPYQSNDIPLFIYSNPTEPIWYKYPLNPLPRRLDIWVSIRPKFLKSLKENNGCLID
jgi:hypothetical protein